MQIGKITIENYRSISKLEIDFSGLTPLVGPNKVGKSTILKAIDIFFEASPRVVKDDFYLHDPNNKISIMIDFIGLTPHEREEFKGAVVYGVLRVAREFGGANAESGDYFVFARVNPAFEAIRNEANGTRKRSLYSDLRKSVPDLPAATSVEDVEEQLRSWEMQNPAALEYQKIKGFFGARNVASGKLRKKTSVRMVPAVKDTSEEASDAKRSPVVALLNEIVRQSFENKEEFKNFVSETNHRLAELTDPAGVPQLQGISKKLTSVLSRYYSDTDLVADLSKANEIVVSFPSPLVNVLHRGLKVDVGSVGHGLQRAIFFSLVQFLAEEQATQPASSDASELFDEAQSDIILLIEEPEIYQHPLKQFLFYEAFKEISAAHNKITGIRIQIIFTTHSEKFVDIRDVEKIRLISKGDVGEKVITEVSCVSLSEFSAAMAKFAGAPNPLPDEAFAATLHIFSREVAEGFFADKILLVEGVSDKAIFEGLCRSEGYNPTSFGLTIIEVGGKTKIDKPLWAFKRLGIPVYAVFDNDMTGKKCKDQAASIKRNLILQRICGSEDEADFPVGVFDSFCSFDGTLERYLRNELNADYEALIAQICESFGLGQRDVVKTPAAISSLVTRAKSRGFTFPMLRDVLEKVRALR